MLELGGRHLREKRAGISFQERKPTKTIIYYNSRSLYYRCYMVYERKAGQLAVSYQPLSKSALFSLFSRAHIYIRVLINV